jgi:phage terminase small subunit
MSPRHKAFADSYLVNGNNGTRAYLENFKTNKASSAGVGANKILKRPEVKAYIDLHKLYSTDEILNSMTVTKDRVLDEEAKLAFVDVRKMFDVDGEFLPPQYWPEEIARAVNGLDVIKRFDPVAGRDVVTYKIKLNDKGRALDRIEKILGMHKMGDLGDDTTNLFRSFLESIDGKSRGVLPSEMEDEQ